jgi:tRNA A-37 threonylcarbamoyl transferase component Bud32
MNFHTKKVTLSELELYTIASNVNCAPKLLKVIVQNNHFIIISEFYPETLNDLYQDKKRKNELIYCLHQVKILLTKLHDNDLLHCDISEENIVYNSSTKDVKLIDFGMSKKISLLNIENIEEYQDLYYEGVKYAGDNTNDINYILKLEEGCVDFLLNHC